MLLIGAGIALPNLLFLAKFRPPKGELLTLSRNLRMKATALAIVGVRQVWLYAVNPDAGQRLTQGERIASAMSMGLVAMSAVYFAWGYFVTIREERRRNQVA